MLERKSMRLKVLIEDLFDISKASSKNITLNLTDVDVVNLFKQVKLELDEKIEKTDLEFKCNYPEEKMTAVLDGQKTYRIFENLIVNVTKYAMPHTRVFVDIFREENEIVVQMKNVSKDELTFNPQEIAMNMKKQGGFIPGIRPGKPTTDYLTKILNSIIFIGAVGLSFVAIVPIFFSGAFGANVSFGGTSLIIIVGVVLETLKQVESQMLVRHYRGFINE